MKRRVVVTGLGIITSNARGVSAFTRAIQEGKSGIGEISQFDTGRYACTISGEIKDPPFEDEPSEHLDRASKLAIIGADLAVEDAGLSPARLDKGNLGVAVGTTCGGVLSLEKICEKLSSDEEKAQIPGWRIDEMSFTAATNHVAKRFKASGPVVTATIACSSGTHAAGMGMDFLRSGQCDIMLVGGVDVVSTFIYRGFAALSGLGAAPYRAFDKKRNGVVLGEGAAFLVLESLDFARERNAHIYGELLGHSFNNDGCFIVNPNPEGEGISRSIHMALEDAGVTPDDIDHINAHGTGTLLNDSAESAGVKRTFGDAATRIPAASIKPMIGHTSGAAGAVELVASILSLKHGFVPPTINFEEPDEQCNLNVSSEIRRKELNTALSANSGFGGSNAAIILRRSVGTTELTSIDEPVVVTGVGALHSEAMSTEEYWSRLKGDTLEAAPGEFSKEIKAFDVFAASGLPLTKNSRRMDLFSKYSAFGAQGALRDAGIDVQAKDEGLGLVLGSAYACLESNEIFCKGLSKVRVNPVTYQNTVSNSATGYMCMLMGIRGAVSVLNQGWLSGAAAIAYAFELVRSGRCSAVVAGGAERLSSVTMLTLERAGVLSKSGRPNPYAVDADGTVATEGSGFLVLESLSHARARGARIYAELTGYGFANAASRGAVSAVARATTQALGNFPKSATGPLHVFGAASGVGEMDRWELEGLDLALKSMDMKATVSSVKGKLGESLGAGGALSAAAAVLSLADGDLLANHLDSASFGEAILKVEADSPGAERSLVSSMDVDGSCVTLGLLNRKHK